MVENQKDYMSHLYENMGVVIQKMNVWVYFAFFLKDAIHILGYYGGYNYANLSVGMFIFMYIIRPWVYGGIVLLLDKKDVFSRPNGVVGSGSLFASELLFAVRAYVNCDLPNLYVLGVIPLCFGIIFGSQKLLRGLYYAGITLMSISLLGIWLNPLAEKPDKLFMVSLSTIFVFFCCFECCKRILIYEENKKVIIEKYKDEAKELHDESRVDGLTKIANFRSLSEKAEEWLPTKQNIAFCIIDLDHFKQVNDTYGHEFGNVVLKRLSMRLSYISSDNVFVARYGGEEFAILTHGMGAKAVFDMVDKLRRNFKMEEYRETKETYSFSGGIALYDGKMSVTELFEAADKKLYEAKHNGRDQISY